MRILLRNFRAGTFFKTITEWTPDPMDAFDFQTTGSAIETARALNFKDLEIVNLTDEGKHIRGPEIKDDP
jgi:hypothetical protein